VKCAVADGEWLFLSPARVTEQTFARHRELGLLIREGMLPVRVEQQSGSVSGPHETQCQ
jgi:hypothetical protein